MMLFYMVAQLVYLLIKTINKCLTKKDKKVGSYKLKQILYILLYCKLFNNNIYSDFLRLKKIRINKRKRNKNKNDI
jgi:hypothetical protein